MKFHASLAKLPDGKWGVRTDATAEVGDLVLVHKGRGKTPARKWDARLTERVKGRTLFRFKSIKLKDLEKMASLPRDTTEADGYAICTLQDGKETFFEKNDISYGRGRVWRVTPEQRLEMQLFLPLEERNPHEKTGSSPALQKKAKDRRDREFMAFKKPEFLALLQRLLKANPPCDLPEDAIVAHAQVERDSFFDRRPERPPSELDLEVLVLSITYDEITETTRHPDLVPRPKPKLVIVRSVTASETRPFREDPAWHNLSQYVNSLRRDPYIGEIGLLDKGDEYHVYCVKQETPTTEGTRKHLTDTTLESMELLQQAHSAFSRAFDSLWRFNERYPIVEKPKDG